MPCCSAAAACLLSAILGAAATIDSQDESLGTPVLQYSFEADNDLDYDGLPDDWIRRKGSAFPRYVKIGIDSLVGSDGKQSLRIDANGAAAILYSPVNIPQARIDELHTYRFRGKIRTHGLTRDAAVISVSLLNHRRQRVQRFLTPMITGTSDEWQTVELKSIVPLPDVRFVVIGCHLAPGEDPGIGGSAWFDDLRLTRFPRLEVASNYFAHFRNEDQPVDVEAHVSGLDDGHDYQLRFQFFDADGILLEERQEKMAADAAAAHASDAAPPRRPKPISWRLSQQPPPGYYRVSATLLRDGQPSIHEQTSLAVMRLVERPRLRGEFGWTIETPPLKVDADTLVNIAAQSGINWIKYPVWNSVRPDDRQYTGDLSQFFDKLDAQNITTIGVFSDPPQRLREKFARNWLGVSEIFSSPPSLWTPTVEPVVARFSSTIRKWQLGDEEDTSFEGLSDYAGTLSRVHDEINRIGLNADLGVSWRRDLPMPDIPPRTLGFVSLRETKPLPMDDLLAAWKAPRDARHSRWLVLQPQLLPTDPDDRANQLVRQMLAARMAGVQAVFMARVLNGQVGLLNPDGSPTDLYLPWRTTALALQNAEFLGEITLPQKSRNAVFARDGEAILFVWNDDPLGATEELYLGEQVVEQDLWGRTKPLPISGPMRLQTIAVGKTPKILRGCSEPIARWRMAAQFEVGAMRSEYGSHQDAILGRNTFSLGVSGKITLETPNRDAREIGAPGDPLLHENDTGWQAEPREWTLNAAAQEPFRLPVFLTLPSDANLGNAQMKLTFDITADRPYRFQVLCPYRIGSGDVSLHVTDRKLPDGRLEIEQTVINSTSPVEILEFRCSLLVPGSRRQKVRVTKLGAGEDRKFYYLPDAEAFRGKELRLKLEQEGGGRILNYKWTVGATWLETAS
jgi:hypothetical protein